MPAATPLRREPVVVIGAGLAGLSAAYDLSKSGRFDVTVLESDDRIGGRVLSVDLDGRVVELGGFMVFPWYHEFRRLLDELGLESLLVRNGYGRPIQYFPDGSGTLRRHTRTPLVRMLPWRRATTLTWPLARGQMKVAEPDLTLFGGGNALEVFGGAAAKGAAVRRMAATANGYTYGPLEDLSADLTAGFFAGLLRHHGFDRVDILPGGTGQVAARLAEQVVGAGGQVLLGQHVTTTRPGVVCTTLAEFPASRIVHAQGLSSAAMLAAVPGVEPSTVGHHTHHVAYVIEVDKPVGFAGDAEWTIAYFEPPSDRRSHLCCVADLSRALHLGGRQLLITYLALNPHDVPPDPAEADAQALELVAAEFEAGHEFTIAARHEWKRTMPVTNTATVAAVRAAQGRDGHFFAGDFLGGPSMETAVATGRRAAHLVLA